MQSLCIPILVCGVAAWHNVIVPSCSIAINYVGGLSPSTVVGKPSSLEWALQWCCVCRPGRVDRSYAPGSSLTVSTSTIAIEWVPAGLVRLLVLQSVVGIAWVNVRIRVRGFEYLMFSMAFMHY